MSSLTTAISVQIDREDKKIANNILKDLGLNMSTFVNMAIKQLIYKDGIPFEVVNPKPSSEFEKSFKESEDILNGSIQRKSYHDIRKMVEDITNEE